MFPAKKHKHLLIVLAWLWRDALFRNRSRVIVIVAASVAGVAVQAAALGIIFAYANGVESGEPLELLGRTFDLRTSKLALLGASLTSFVIMLLAAVLVYSSRTSIVRLRRRYEDFCSQRYLMLLSHLPHPETTLANQMVANDTAVQVIKRGPRSTSRVLQLLLYGMVPIGWFVVSGVFMFISSFVFSSIVVLLAFIALLFHYRVNVAAVKTTRKGETHAVPAARERMGLVRRAMQSAGTIDLTDRLMTELYTAGDISKSQEAEFDRYIIKDQATLVTNVLAATAIVATLLVMGGGVIAGNGNWTILVGYLVALRFFLSNARSVGNLVIMSSRFYPLVRDYHDFVEDADRALRRTPPPAADPRPVCLSIPSLDSGDSRLIIEPGEKVLLLHPGPPTRLVATLLQMRTLPCNGKPPAEYQFVGQFDTGAATLRHGFSFPEAVRDADVARDLKRVLSDQAAVTPFVCRLDDPFDPDQVAAMPPELSRSLGTLAALYSDRPAIIVAPMNAYFESRLDLSELEKMSSDHVVIELCGAIPDSTASHDQPVIMSTGRDFDGWCTVGWLREHPKVLEAYLAQTSALLPGGGGGFTEDDDDDA